MGALTQEEWLVVAGVRRKGLDLGEVVRAGVGSLEAVARAGTVGQMEEMRLLDLRNEGKSGKYVTNVTHFLKRVTAHFGKDLALPAITTMDCAGFLHSQGWAARSVIHFRGYLVAAFNCAVTHGLTTINPAKGMKSPSHVRAAIAVATVKQVGAVLDACPVGILPGIALATFAGLRPESEMMRLDYAQVKLDRGFIEVMASKSKTAMRRLVRVHPTLRAWLLHAHGGAVPVSGPVWPAKVTARRRWREVREACGWNSKSNPWPQDLLRHSYASYLLASNNDAAATAEQLGHMTTAMLYQHYREVVTREDAAAFWAVLPVGPPPDRLHD